MTTASQQHFNPADVVAQASLLLKEDQRHEAQELLLVEGFVKRADPTIQTAYLEMIPASPTLLEIQAESYDYLQDADAKVRLKAVTRIARECARVYPRNSVRWMRDPRATEPLMQTAVNDPDRKVAEKALLALGRILCSYFPDQRALPVLLLKLKDSAQVARASSIGGIGCLRREELLEHLADLLERGTERDRELVISSVSGLAYETEANGQRQLPITWSAGGKRKWVLRMIAALGDREAGIRLPAAVALKHFMDPSALPALRAAHAIETNESIAFFISDAIKALESIG
jgi:HEAT repeat protein